MSTVAEHLAALECMLEMRYSKDANVRRYSAFSQEAAMFCEVHLKELVALIEPEAIVAAREDVERRYREQLPDMAEQIIREWTAARATMADALAAGDGTLHGALDFWQDRGGRLKTLLADCRDAFPAPDPGTPLEMLWADAMTNAAAVPAYLRGVAASFPPSGGGA